jgi:hypothetical protein
LVSFGQTTSVFIVSDSDLSLFFISSVVRRSVLASTFNFRVRRSVLASTTTYLSERACQSQTGTLRRTVLRYLFLLSERGRSDERHINHLQIYIIKDNFVFNTI